jgi:hypothetical protein
MTTTTEAPFESISKAVDVAREAFESQLRLSADFAELAQSATKEGSDPIEAGRVYFASAWREAGNYWQAVADLNLRYATAVVKIGAHAGELVIADVDAAIKRSRSEKSEKEAKETPSSDDSASAAATRRSTSRRKQS